MIPAFEDGLLSVAAVAAAAALGWAVIAHREPAPPAPAQPLTVITADPAIDAIAEAIAVAEGYYAPGEHDGHSLPYLLNNPGSLKKPALNAGALSTWKDTGLVIFPSREMGWAALRNQVRLMLTGDSQVYELSDTLLHVARKYADGDTNWGRNVASTLGVSTGATLRELAPTGGGPPER